MNIASTVVKFPEMSNVKCVKMNASAYKIVINNSSLERDPTAHKRYLRDDVMRAYIIPF